MLQKVIVLFATFYAIGIAQSCCRCGPVTRPYFDYSQVSIMNQSEIVNRGSAASIIVMPEDIEYVAKANTCHSMPSVFSTLMACSCQFNGELEKFSIQKVNIYPDSIFHEGYSYGESITPLFGIVEQKNDGEIIVETKPMDEAFLQFKHEGGFIEIATFQTPVKLNRPYTFTIELIKENGERLSIQTAEIKWTN